MGHRFCADYRLLNVATIKDCFRIPTVKEILDKITAPVFPPNGISVLVTIKSKFIGQTFIRQPSRAMSDTMNSLSSPSASPMPF